MSPVSYVKPQKVTLKDHPELTEKWLQDRIAEDPTLLALGDLILKDRERLQPHAGRLDLLFQDAEANHRYEVEIQLGKTDESHIIRTIEYWDLERKRYPQYDHTAVIIAEEITSRFLNVVSLFNGFIPLVALQLQALRLGDQISLVFTTVLGEVRLGMLEEDEEAQVPADRAYWERRGSKNTLAMADQMLAMIQSVDKGLAFKYNRFYIGLVKQGQPNNFVSLRPKKDWLRFEPRLERSDEIQTKLDEAGLDLMEYDSRRGRYRIRLVKADLAKHEALLMELIKAAYEQAGSSL